MNAKLWKFKKYKIYFWNQIIQIKVILLKKRNILIVGLYLHCYLEAPFEESYFVWRATYFWSLFLWGVTGLDEGEQENQDPASLQGAFLAFLHLRHLRIRDLQRTVSDLFCLCMKYVPTLLYRENKMFVM